ncbi:MAG: TonB-dependent receptor [Bacteroidetes bacterium]|nr:TonB-dependent receptor [Bacteroidota bacterium]
MNNKIFLLLIFLMLPLLSHGQMINGTVYEIRDSEKVSLPGVNIYWANSEIGIASDKQGKFSLYKPEGYDVLVFSFIGYENDSLKIELNNQDVEMVLANSKMIDEVTIVQRRMGTYIDRLSPVQTENITGAELCKAACCNLAESFETNASIDAYYSNAVTGAKQIRLLGLDGMYIQLMTENIPTLRGLASPYGLGYIPGSWMEAIQISKGTASVKNGYESIAGQINVEYLKPHTADKVFFNGLINDAGKKELNAVASLVMNDNLSTLVLAHVEDNSQIDDHQGDGFLDHPMLTQYNFLNRWYYNTSHWHVHAGIKALIEERSTGQVDFDRDQVRDIDHPYGIGIDTDRLEGFLKMGYTFNNEKHSNFGSIYSISGHNQESFFGIRDYTGKQINYYMNLMFQTDLFSEDHTLTSGYSLNYDDYNEMIDQTELLRKEIVQGVFSEYSFKIDDRFIFQSGLRLDYNSIYGWLFTPRVHARYNVSEHTLFRISAGKGYRSPNVLAENNHFLANSRAIIIGDNLNQEEAWNYGLNLTQYFKIGPRQLSVNLDAHRTNFINQVIVDLDSSTDEVRFFNLDGQSFSNNFQAEVSYELIRGLDARAAFRYTDVKYTLNENLVDKPLISKYKGLLTMSYATPLKKWQIDFTTQFNGPGRIPSTMNNPEEYRIPEEFDPYTIIHTQITKYFRTWSIYVGAENLTNFTQEHPVIASDQPFGEYFDGSLIWGPLHGRKVYIGFRFGINREEPES